MKKIETTLADLRRDISAFYKPELHHFMVMNAVETGGGRSQKQSNMTK
jgi:hypothetical protein